MFPVFHVLFGNVCLHNMSSLITLPASSHILLLLFLFQDDNVLHTFYYYITTVQISLPRLLILLIEVKNLHTFAKRLWSDPLIRAFPLQWISLTSSQTLVCDVDVDVPWVIQTFMNCTFCTGSLLQCLIFKDNICSVFKSSGSHLRQAFKAGTVTFLDIYMMDVSFIIPAAAKQRCRMKFWVEVCVRPWVYLHTFETLSAFHLVWAGFHQQHNWFLLSLVQSANSFSLPDHKSSDFLSVISTAEKNWVIFL